MTAASARARLVGGRRGAALIVDEAHHLQWSPQESSIEYSCIEQLASVISGVLLLTATPEQLGKQSHFARLRLLDPDRYYDLQTFLEEEKNYQPVAEAVEQLLHQSFLPEAAARQLEPAACFCRGSGGWAA